MLKFDFLTYANEFINKEEYNRLYSKKDEYIEKLNNSTMTGWINEISEELKHDIKNTAKYIKENYDCLVVIGIGGSYLGSYSFSKIFQKYYNNTNFEVLYAGVTLSSKALDELLLYLNNKNYCINVISKSGNTMETTITYNALKKHLLRNYGEEELKKRIIVTTDKNKGKLREEVNREFYKSFEIPDNIGGRFSFITPAHLLPLALNYDITEIIDGYYDGKRFIDIAFSYAVIRKLMFDSGKYVEAFCFTEELYTSFGEWLKQLFGESEGKNGVGILPISLIYTRDLHSLGQFVQDGNKIIFETYIKINDSSNYIEYDGEELKSINNKVMESVMKAHNIGSVPCLEIEITEKKLDEIASLIYFFQLAAAFSGFLLGIDPFTQNGVEIYKEEVRKSFSN